MTLLTSNKSSQIQFCVDPKGKYIYAENDWKLYKWKQKNLKPVAVIPLDIGFGPLVVSKNNRYIAYNILHNLMIYDFKKNESFEVDKGNFLNYRDIVKNWSK